MARVTEQHTGGMIALVPSAADAARLAVPDGDDAAELHLTLAYLGDDVTGLASHERAALESAVRHAGARFAPVEASAMAHAVFNPNGGEYDPATVYLISGAGLDEVREAVAEHSVSEHPTFLPHVTAGYDLETDALDYTGPVRFDRMRLALADDVFDVPLTGAPVEETPGPDADDTEEKTARDGHVPPQGVQRAAKRAQQLIAAGKAGPGFTDVGRKRAADLAAGRPVGDETARRMKAYFDRHQVDRGHHWGKAGAETPGYVAWLAWGGDPGYAWARKIARQLDGDGSKHMADDLDPEFKAGPPQASERAMTSTAAAPTTIPEKGSKKKRKVATEKGEARYGLPIGTELGKARDERAKGAQSDKGAQKLYGDLSKVDPAKYREHLDKLSDADLQKLSRLLYSARSSNPAIVRARVAVSGALRRRGQNVDDHGGLGKGGGGRSAPKRSGGAGSKIKGNSVKLGEISDAEWDRLRAEGWKGRPGDREERLYRPGSKGADVMTEQKTISAERRREAATLPGSGDPGKFPIDGEDTLRSAIRLHNSSDEPAEAVRTHIMTQARNLGLMHVVPDDWKDSGKGEKSLAGVEVDYAEAWLADAEAKAAGPRTTTKPWETRKAQRAGKTIGKDKSEDPDGGDEYPIRTIGDVAAAIKRANKITDPERKREVQAHIRKGAGKINASNMIPKNWATGADSGGKSSGKKPNPFGKKKDIDTGLEYSARYTDLADAIEAKVMSPDPRAVKLRNYWAYGEGRKKWRPGTGGDFNRLKRQVRKYIPAHMLNGFVANVHKLATGQWPGRGRHHGKALDLGDDHEVSVINAVEVKDALSSDAGDDDAVTLALDSYADLADQLTSDEEYEEALAREIDWDMLADGTLAEREVEPGVEDWDDGFGDDPDGFTGGDEDDEGEADDGPSDEGEDYDPEGMLSELESMR